MSENQRCFQQRRTIESRKLEMERTEVKGSEDLQIPGLHDQLNGKPYSHVKAVQEEAMRKLEEVGSERGDSQITSR